MTCSFYRWCVDVRGVDCCQIHRSVGCHSGDTAWRPFVSTKPRRSPEILKLANGVRVSGGGLPPEPNVNDCLLHRGKLNPPLKSMELTVPLKYLSLFITRFIVEIKVSDGVWITSSRQVKSMWSAYCPQCERILQVLRPLRTPIGRKMPVWLTQW